MVPTASAGQMARGPNQGDLTVPGRASVRAGALVFCGANLFGLMTSHGIAAEDSGLLPRTQDAVVMRYDIDAEFAYIDAASRPSRPAVVERGSGTRHAATAAPRVLGLKRARIAGNWRAAESSALSLVFRPDALNRQSATGTAEGGPAGEAGSAATTGAGREFDSRTGQPYRPAPTVKLLDSYVLTLSPGRSLEASLGVFEELITRKSAYPQLLEFGLETRFVAKFSAFRVGWRMAAEPTDLRTGVNGLSADLFLYQGDQDRVETDGIRVKTSDEAPVAADPYMGAALALSWFRSPGLGVHLTGGSHDTAAGDGRVNETFGRLALVAGMKAAGRAMGLALDVRTARERWRGDSLEVATRSQTSVALTGSVQTLAHSSLLLGIHAGHSDDHPSRWGLAADERVPLDGQQADVGWLTELGSGVELVLQAAEERRLAKPPGGDSEGAIVRGDAEARRVVRRVGVQIQYQFEGDG